jgi:integrase
MTNQAIHVRRQRRRTLTDRMVAALPRRRQPYFHPDPELPKHGVRVRPEGPGAYTIITRDPFKKQRWTKIGSTAEMTIDEARGRAREVIRRVEAGLAPFEAPKPKAESVAAVAANWLHRHVDRRGLRTAAEQHRIVSKYILPHLGDRTFVDIKRRDVAALLDYVEDRHGPQTADQVLCTLRSMASWVQQRDDEYVPPFVKNMRRTPKQDRRRSRVLYDDELRKVWRAAGDAGAYGVAVKSLLFTAQRREKILSLKWFAVSEGVWTIETAAREKGNPGSLVLPRAVLDLLEAVPRFVGSDHVFAGTGSDRRDFNLAWQKSGLDRASGVTGWRLHDLRRTARSLMSRAGVPTEIAERVLGHARPQIESTYDVHTYDREKADALAKLANLIERIVNPPAGSNVVPMHETAAV